MATKTTTRLPHREQDLAADLERLHSELLSMSSVIDYIATTTQSDVGGALGGVSVWLQRITGEMEETITTIPKGQLSAAE